MFPLKNLARKGLTVINNVCIYISYVKKKMYIYKASINHQS